VHRLVVTLTHEGLLTQNPQTARYRLGAQLHAMGKLYNPNP